MFDFKLFSELCDRAMVEASKKLENFYITTDGGIVIPPPNPYVVDWLEAWISKEVVNPHTVLISTCQPHNNWRDPSGVVCRSWMVRLIQNSGTRNGQGLSVSPVFESAFWDIFGKLGCSKVELPDVDGFDVLTVLESIYLGKPKNHGYENQIIQDGNAVLSHLPPITVEIVDKVAVAAIDQLKRKVN